MHPTGMEWADIPAEHLNISACLTSGQAFRWRRHGEEWVGVIGDTVARLTPRPDGFWWATSPEPGRWDVIAGYFALDVDLAALHDRWLDAEPWCGPAIAACAGLRVLRQEASEVFFAFLCATCNTVTKIARSVNRLAERYGEPLADPYGEVQYRFPSAARLAEASEEALRCDRWGYRAPRVIDLARHVAERGPGWLPELQARPYAEAHAELASLFGIGAKVADCICLFGLWHDQAVPVDTHIRRIATRALRPDLVGRSLTPDVYCTIASEFRCRFGPYAGWAQQYLFHADLLARGRGPGEAASAQLLEGT